MTRGKLTLLWDRPVFWTNRTNLTSNIYTACHCSSMWLSVNQSPYLSPQIQWQLALAGPDLEMHDPQPNTCVQHRSRCLTYLDYLINNVLSFSAQCMRDAQPVHVGQELNSCLFKFNVKSAVEQTLTRFFWGVVANEDFIRGFRQNFTLCARDTAYTSRLLRSISMINDCAFDAYLQCNFEAARRCNRTAKDIPWSKGCASWDI